MNIDEPIPFVLFVLFVALFSLAYAANVKAGPKNHSQQEKHRDQHDKTIPQLL